MGELTLWERFLMWWPLRLRKTCERMAGEAWRSGLERGWDLGNSGYQLPKDD